THRWDDPSLPIHDQGHRLAPTTIGDHVWIGGNATINPGITIAPGTVVGAGAVVTADTQPYTIVAGVPAREIGTRPRPVARDRPPPRAPAACRSPRGLPDDGPRASAEEAPAGQDDEERAGQAGGDGRRIGPRPEEPPAPADRRREEDVVQVHGVAPLAE